MAYDLADLPLHTLLGPLSRTDDLLARLDERVRTSSVREGFTERQHFADAAAALWLEGDLVHIEELVLHDAHMDIRAPTHELTRAHAVLRARRRILSNKPDWALSRAGLTALRGREGEGGRNGASAARATSNPAGDVEAFGQGPDQWEVDRAAEADRPDPFAEELAEIDAVLARASRILAGAPAMPREAIGKHSDREGEGRDHATAPRTAHDALNPLIHDPDWDEAARLTTWLTVVNQAKSADLPAVLLAAIAWEAWERIEPLQHQAWLGNLLVSAQLREIGKVGSHLFALNTGLKLIARERRKHPVRTTRLLALLEAFAEAASAGMKEVDRLVMAKSQMERRLKGRRATSKLPELVELMLARPIVSAGLIAGELRVSQRAALDLLGELSLRELTGRGRYRAWGIL